MDFLHTTSYGGLSCTCDQGGQHWYVLAIADQCLLRVKSFSVSQSSSPKQVGWGSARGWEVTQLGQLTTTDQRGIPYIIYNFKLSYKTGRKFSSVTFTGGLTAHQSPGGDCSCIARFLFCFQMSPLPIKLSQPTIFLTFALLIPSTPEGSEWAATWVWAACWVLPTRNQLRLLGSKI